MQLTDRQRETIPYLALALSVFAAYANVYHNQFLFDDRAIIVDNGFLRHWSHISDIIKGRVFGADDGHSFYRPLPLILYVFIYQFFGLSTVAFHGLNVALQAINAGLVYRLGRGIGLRQGVSFSAALLWAVHPLWTEVVTYASSTPELLYTLFCLAGIIVLLPDFTPKKIWLSAAFFVPAVLCKESAVVFPALATLTLFLVSEERLRPATYIRTWPLWLLAAAYVVAWYMCPHMAKFTFHDPQDAFYNQSYENNIFNRILTSLATLPTYFRLVIWPACLHMERSFPIFTGLLSWRVLLGMAIVAGVLLQIAWGRGRHGLAFSWGFIWFAAAFSPNTGIVKTLYALVSEHWMYLPGIGLFLGVAQTVAVWIDKQKSEKVPYIVAVAVVLAALSLGIKTHLQNKVWHNPVVLYEHILHCGSNSGRAHNNLGHFYFGQGEYEKAEAHFKAAAAHPAPMWISMTSSVHLHLALIYLGAMPDEKGFITPEKLALVLPFASRLPEAVEELKKALAAAPQESQDAYWAGQFLAIIDEYQDEKKKNAAH